MKAAGVLLVSMFSLAAAAADLTGRPSVIDGDTLDMRGQRIRLWDIDAPESSQLCRGPDSLHYRCGAWAANRLSDYIAGRPVTCAQRDVDRYGRIVASCTVAGLDLGSWLVASGLAIDYAQYSRGAYAADQAKAQAAETGMWAGSFTEPAKYRQCFRGSGDIGRCSDIEPEKP